MNKEAQSQYWLNPIIDEIEEKYPEGEIILSSGIAPSASYHIGHFREILSADLLKWGLEQRSRKVKHIHVVDNFDPLRKRYDFLPESYEKYIGWPVCLVPDPFNCHESYAEHFYQEFYTFAKELITDFEVLYDYEDLYKSGKMAPQIERVISKVPEIKKIFAEVSNRHLPDEWMPLQILSDNNSFDEWKYKAIATEKQQIQYSDKDGNTGWVGYADGRVKLPWRLDWPARWDLLGVMVEPHGFQEHGASGGSYETGLLFAKEVFGSAGPIAGFQYGHIHLLGDNIKMSSSKGNHITPEEALKIMPPEMLRYFYARYPGKKRIDFDPGVGLFRMMDEFSAVDEAVRGGQTHQFESAYKYAVAHVTSPGMIPVRFNHLVNIYQSALGDINQVIKMLSRTGFDVSDEQMPALERELTYVRAWLETYAPEDIKFSLVEEIPSGVLQENEMQFARALAEAIEKEGRDKDGQWFHSLIHETRESFNLNPADAFKVVYKSILGQDAGPKAGWFLSILDTEWLVERFKEVS